MEEEAPYGGRGGMAAPRVELLEGPLRHHAWRRPPAQPEPVAERAGHFADAVHFALAHPASIHQLHAATGVLDPITTPERALPAMLLEAVGLARADLGDIQVLDPATGDLLLVAHAGFDADFVTRFGLMGDPSTVCGRAAARGQQVLVPDVEDDDPSGPHRAAASAFGFRSVLSTPLRDYERRLVGVVSVHWRARRHPSPAGLRLMELFADYCGERLATMLAPTAGEAEDTVGPVARAMIDAVLGPPPWPGPAGAPAPGSVDITAARSGAFAGIVPSDRVATLADLVVTGLFSAELELDAARSLTPEGPLASRIGAATNELENLVAEVRRVVLPTVTREDEGPAAR